MCKRVLILSVAAVMLVVALCWASTSQDSQGVRPAPKAADLLRQTWQLDGQDMWYRVMAPAAMAPYDPDAALKIAESADGTVPDEAIAQIGFDLMAADRARSLQWLPLEIEKAKNGHVKLRLWATLGDVAANSGDMDRAAQFYEKAKALAGVESPVPQMMWEGSDDLDYAFLAGLAGRLGRSQEAASWVEKLKAALKDSSQSEDALSTRSRFIAMGDAGLAEQVVTGMSRMNATQGLADAAAEASFYDVKLAKRLLAKIAAMGANGHGDLFYGEASLYVVLACAKSDPKGMLDLARGIKDARYKPLALTLVAPSLRKDEALKVYREAFNAVLDNSNSVPTDQSWIAGQAYKLDKTVGAQMFGEARKGLARQREMRTDDIANFAYYMREFDPAGARLMLETELNRAKHLPKASGTDWTAYHIARAMVALDPARAVEIATQASGDNPTCKSWALRRVGGYLLESPERRARRDYLHRMRSEMWIYGGATPQ